MTFSGDMSDDLEAEEDKQSSTTDATVSSALRSIKPSLSKAELRVAEALLSNYPVSGITTASALAAQAGVSDPTVTRLVARLGFASFSEMRDSLLKELELRLAPPRYSDPLRGDRTFKEFGVSAAMELANQIQRSMNGLLDEEIKRAVDLLGDIRRDLYITGGRASRTVAMQASWTMEVIRPKVRFLEDSEGARINALLDISKGTTVLLLDYRRYQREAVEFARSVKEAGASLIVMTDPFLSPASAYADVVLTSEIEGLSPFNTMVPTLALVELLTALVARNIFGKDDSRLNRYVDLSHGMLLGRGGVSPVES
ncbi:transcriptional regulator, RpiR family [Ferrithrix thermotolerans DSM 19514]|jgi:DNA-binding MurR/RpiR family transcriptional regulator|uniref:Transcriptional regulator, RpiR family n=1 Tax=Ferrithrix thermotolerans DSM 19514 TaxID=1121881 RepID=A0A1M4WK37_9ACTN|nr:MurR/RpiR family transcriptional regulator [Ferrithrix thermotolerans]SHE81598.1 transcriptional regulator, RpiR family [Ferrithrix thermotolerans DSM 19514]